MTPAIQTQALAKGYRRAQALHPTTLTVPRGSVFALVGHNGAGKTTLIKLLMNMIHPTSGSATILGKDCTHLTGEDFTRIAYASENQELPDWMTVGQFLTYLKGFYPTWDDAALVQQLDLPLDRKLKHLSRGMLMKAALASILAFSPEIILLDEPFSGLDPLVRDELIEALMARVRPRSLAGSEALASTSEESRPTVLISSHDLAEVESFATHIGFLHQGKLLFAEELHLAHRALPRDHPHPPAAGSRRASRHAHQGGHSARFLAAARADPHRRPLRPHPRRHRTRRRPDRRSLPRQHAQHPVRPHDPPRHLPRARKIRPHPRRPHRREVSLMALPQPLHIFRKDLIHLWPETLFVLVLFVAFAYTAPSAWASSEYLVLISLLSLLIKILMVVSWLVLIARAIQDESLVGDRQFWTSRPYHWASLFAAKILLIIVCIYVPFFLMQAYLLHHSGLHPMLVIPALLHNLLLLTVVLIIPLAALSAVTSTFPRVLLTFVAVGLGIVILFLAIFYARFLQMEPPHIDWIVYTVLIALPFAALVYQYKTRKTLISRLILAATPLITILIIFLTPNAALIDKSYPVVTGPKLTGLSSQYPTGSTPSGELTKFRDHVPVSLPVAVTGVDKDVDFIVQGVRTTITGPGISYASPFMSSTVPILRPNQFSADRPAALVNFLIPADVLKKIGKTPVDLHIQLASDQLKADKPSTWHATLLPFSVPGGGICSFPDENAPPNPMMRGNASAPLCRYALQAPDFSFVSADLAPGNGCANPSAPRVPGRARIGGNGATLDFDPVVTVPMLFETGDPQPIHSYNLCPGSELTFVSAQTLPNASLILDQKQVVLDPFAQRYSPRTAIPPPRRHPSPLRHPSPVSSPSHPPIRVPQVSPLRPGKQRHNSQRVPHHHALSLSLPIALLPRHHQQLIQPSLLLRIQPPEQSPHHLRQRPIQLPNQPAPLVAQRRHHHPPVHLRAHPLHPSGLLHPLQNSRHIRNLRHQPRLDLILAKPLRPRPPQNPQHVVLRRRQAIRPQALLDLVPYLRRRPRQIQPKLFPQALERNRLPNLILQR